MSSSKDNATKNLLPLPELVEKLLQFLNLAKVNASTIEIIPSRTSLTRCGGTCLVHYNLIFGQVLTQTGLGLQTHLT